ncbi:hypothetical protein ACSNOI_19790, partial [Actinomadura kijaniata]
MLVLVAIALLVAGVLAGNGDNPQVFGVDALYVIYASIAVSVVSFLCLAIGVFLRRKEIFGPGAAPAAGTGRKAAKKDKDGKGKKGRKDARPAPAGDASAAPDPSAAPADDEAAVPAPAVEVPEDSLVHVVRGRRRYHLDTCRQLAGRETEELTYVEAREEGFSPCTACMPDTALAARAAISAPAKAKSAAVSTTKSPAAATRTATKPATGVKTGTKTGTAAESGGTPPGASGPAKPADPVKPAASSAPAPTAPLPSAWPVPGKPADQPADKAPGKGPGKEDDAGTKPAEPVTAPPARDEKPA